MISTSRSTQTWSKSPQTTSSKSDGQQVLSPDDLKKALGDKDLGTVLNEIADPNYVDPSKPKNNAKKDLDKDAFFKLMLAQMKNQDPLRLQLSGNRTSHHCKLPCSRLWFFLHF